MSKVEEVLKNYYDVSFSRHSGVLVNERLMRKLVKIQYRHMQEIKRLLVNNLDDFEVSNWTLAYPNGEQTEVRYFNKNSSKEEKLDRIEALKHICRVEYNPRIFKVNGKDYISDI